MVYEKDFHMDSTVELTVDVLSQLIRKHQSLVPMYKELNNLYIGQHDILSRDPKPIGKPDNRVVANFAKYIVDTFNGYFIGIPVRTISDRDSTNDYIQQLEKENNIDDNNAELAKLTSIYGHAYELIFLDEEAQIGLATLSPREAFLVYDNSIRERPLFGVRYESTKDGVRGTVSDRERIIYFSTTQDGLKFDEEVPHYFGGVPLVEYVENAERIGAFETVKTLITCYNKTISEKANDVDYFADAYMKILGAKVDDATLSCIKDNRIINMGDADMERLPEVAFMEKPDADGTQEHLLDRMERLIFALSMVSNISDENFGTVSGIALKYRLQSMSNLAATKERKFVRGFNRRFKLISQVPNSRIAEEDLVRIDYRFTRNVPTNIQEEAETAKMLQGIVSDETTLQTLSIIPDAKAELKRIDDEIAEHGGHDLSVFKERDDE